MKYILLYICIVLAMLKQASAQLSYEIFTDKNSYTYGESIILTGRVYNNADTTVTFIGDSEGFITPVFFNGAALRQRSLALDVQYVLPAKSWYSCRYVFIPQELGLPNKEGINKIECSVYWYFYPGYHGFSTTDTIEINAPAYYSGPIEVYYAVDSLSSVAALRDSFNAQVLQSDTSFSNVNEIWQTNGYIIDSLVNKYSNDSRFIEIHAYRDLWTSSIYITSLDINENHPARFVLEQNYPNPFNPETNIQYTIGSFRAQHAIPQHVKLTVYNSIGQKVAVLVNDDQPAGTYKVHWNASGSSSGIYFYRLQINDFIKTKKMILIR